MCTGLPRGSRLYSFPTSPRETHICWTQKAWRRWIARQPTPPAWTGQANLVTHAGMDEAAVVATLVTVLARGLGLWPVECDWSCPNSVPQMLRQRTSSEMRCVCATVCVPPCVCVCPLSHPFWCRTCGKHSYGLLRLFNTPDRSAAAVATLRDVVTRMISSPQYVVVQFCAPCPVV